MNRPQLAHISLYRHLNTPLGPVFWNPAKTGEATVVGVVAATIALFGGAALGVQIDGGVATTFVALGASVMGGVSGFLATLKV